MNPVFGLDVSKGESQVQTFLYKSQPYFCIRFFYLFKVYVIIKIIIISAL